MQYEINVVNMKCSGCVQQITRRIKAIGGLKNIDIDLSKGSVSFQADDPLLSERVRTELLEMGYPELGSIEGVSAIKAKAKSFVSCAIGKMTKE